ncbi:MAG: FAD-dependent oxidoreductase [Candidatus Marinimicrobia bacterium]|nr:FAD-dependent oxidoreductase [Candidatus Neomarinimicrobiota bacterium]
MSEEKVLIMGSGLPGMRASLLLANAGKTVYLVEKLSNIGGDAIKNEESFPKLECSTCMVAPTQQEVLHHPKIKTMTLCKVEKITGKVGKFNVSIKKKARFVSETDCIGCDACFPPCPVSISNEWEENLIDKKAIFVPCPGSLPNVPMINTEHCLHINGKKKECKACVEACMFDAINLDDKDEMIDVEVGAIIIAIGSETYDVSTLSQFGYGNNPSVYTAMEFERLFSSNGPTKGELTLRKTEKEPKSVAIIHCVGREEQGYCSGICCMYSVKHAHFIKHKLPKTKIYNIHTDICVADKTYFNFVENFRDKETKLIYHSSMKDLKVEKNGNGLSVNYLSGLGAKEKLDVDMVILASAMVPGEENKEISEMIGIDLDNHGFFMTKKDMVGSVESSKEGIFIAGCAEGPKDIQTSVIQAEATVSGVMKIFE